MYFEKSVCIYVGINTTTKVKTSLMATEAAQYLLKLLSLTSCTVGRDVTGHGGVVLLYSSGTSSQNYLFPHYRVTGTEKVLVGRTGFKSLSLIFFVIQQTFTWCIVLYDTLLSQQF